MGYFWKINVLAFLDGPLVLQWCSTCGTSLDGLEVDNRHRHAQPLPMIVFSFVTTSILDCQTHTLFEHFLGLLLCRLMVQSGHFLCNVFRVYLV